MEYCFAGIYFYGFTLDTFWLTLVLGGLLVFSALVSAAETAFFSLSPHDVRKLKGRHARGATTALQLLNMQDYLLATILIFNNLVNICAVIVANRILDGIFDFGDSSGFEFLVKVIIVTLLLLFFGEIMPKVFATYNALRYTQVISVPLMGLKHFFKPLSYVLIRSSSYVNERIAKKRENISMDELSNALEIAASSQDVEEKRILSGIVNFVNTEVVEIMRPRMDVVALESTATLTYIYETIIGSGFSRIPVYTESLDNITGILYVKDLLPYLSENKRVDWHDLCRRPYFVPEHKKINDLLVEFQTQKIHIAIVVDEYGSTLGLISLEDILEEIVGDISDESDSEERFYTKVDVNTYLFEGKTHLNDFLRVVGLPEDCFTSIKEDAETIAGLLLELQGEFLKVGDHVEYGGCSFQVESLSGRRIDKVKVTIHA